MSRKTSGENLIFKGMLMCLSRGYIVKLAKRTPDKKFRTCFPPKTTTCNIRRESILNLFSNNFKYYIYSELFEQERG